MPVKCEYEVDGDIFREIRENWLFANVREFLICARHSETDRAGNKIECFQLNDGRTFTRIVGSTRTAMTASKTIPSGPRMTAIMADRSATQPR